MGKVTLETLFSELKKLEVNGDVRFEFLKEQIQANHAEMRANFGELKANFGELKTNHAELRADHVGLKSGIAAEFAHVQKKLNVIRDQTAHITERVAGLEHMNKEV